MLHLPELRRLNDERSRQLMNPVVPKPAEMRHDDFIIVVYSPKKVKSYYDRGEYYVTDRSKVRGWTSYDFEDAIKRATQLDDMVALDVAVSIDRRGTVAELSKP